MHLVVGVICIAAGFVFDECKTGTVAGSDCDLHGFYTDGNSQPAGVCARRWDVAADETAVS